MMCLVVSFFMVFIVIKFILSISLFLFPLFLCANEWASFLPKGTQLSYLVLDPANNKVISEYEASILRTPASMQKLLTATAAKLYLGDNFAYQTLIKGNKEKIKDGFYQGDLSFHFVGDPTLLRSDIKKMLIQLKKLGIKQVNGNFVLNQSHFNGYQWSNGQAWNDLGVCYTAPASAIIVNKNCVLGNLNLSANKADKAILFIPPYEPVEISSDVSLVTQLQKEAQFCELEVTRNSQNRYHLWGCVVPRNRPFALAFAVNDPFAYAKQIFTSELHSAGIALKGTVKLESESSNNTNNQDVLVKHQSALLDELLQVMMKESDNLIADSLFKTLGWAYFQTAGNFRNGAQAVKAILKAEGVDLENAYLADGSGLSRHNLMSAELFMEALNYIYQHEKKLQLLSSFSRSGEDGTLKYHRGVRGKLLKGKIIAKTGSMKGVSNLLGIIKTEHGDRLFVLILNGYNLSETVLKDPTISKKDYKSYFQQAFLENLIKAEL